MTILVTGGSASGKSLYAETVTQSFKKNLIYIATMKPYDDECFHRIERHQNQRAGKGFSTIECYGDLREITVPKNSTILLECVGNLVTNTMFCDNPPVNPLKTICDGLDFLHRHCENLVVVTNEVGSDGAEYNPHLVDYIRLTGQVNAYAGRSFDCVTEVVCGIPLTHKGEIL